jgi:hypothetical protein
LRWSAVGYIGLPYWKIRSILPSGLRTRVDGLVQHRAPTDMQLKKIGTLGELIGLNKEEVYAAYDSPANLTQWSNRRFTPFSALIILIIIIIASLVIIVLSVNYYAPPPVYAAGPRYGSIKPQDFILD